MVQALRMWWHVTDSLQPKARRRLQDQVRFDPGILSSLERRTDSGESNHGISVHPERRLSNMSTHHRVTKLDL